MHLNPYIIVGLLPYFRLQSKQPREVEFNHESKLGLDKGREVSFDMVWTCTRTAGQKEYAVMTSKGSVDSTHTRT